FSAFRSTYGDLRDNPELQEDLANRIAPFLKRRTKAEVCAELPPKEERMIFCDMHGEQRALYETLRETGRKQLADCERSDKRINAEIFTTLLRLRQTCCHPALLPDSPSAPSAKFELLQELVLEHIDSGHKLLLFSQFTSFLAKITEWLDRDKIAYEYLDGSTRNRQDRVDNFNNNAEIPIFLLSLKAGGTGLNLTSADTVILCDPWWNPAVELQAADRTHRIGQSRPVTSLKLLVRDSIEEKILALQEKKQQMFDNVIDNPSIAATKFTIEDLKFLLN
ncbi:MAG: DEAD/DEAH box helicase, partial [Victivallaceae bacterium]